MDLIHIAKAAEEATNNGVAGMFGLDAKLFLAQMINFGIVLFVLGKWVFKPLGKMLQSRSKRIETALLHAKAIEAQKEEFAAWKQDQIGQARQEAAGLIDQAKMQAQAVQQETLDKTKQVQEKLVNQAKAQIEQEKSRAVAEIKEEVGTLVVAATQKILGEKLDSAQDQKLIERALKDVRI